MSVPAAYQVGFPLGANIGGVNPAFFVISADIEFDSWLTVGVTDGQGVSALSSIGVDFDRWTATSGIETTNGAVFWMNPNDAPGGDVVVAQLTVGRGVTAAALTCAFGLTGKSAAEDSDWEVDNVVWSLTPPPPPRRRRRQHRHLPTRPS